MLEVELNLWAVLGAAVASMVIGGLWYSPLLFGKTWMHLSGLTMESMEKEKKKAPRGYALTFIGSLLTGYVLAHFLTYASASTGETGYLAGLQGSFWVWLGFFVPVMLGSFLWEGKPFKLYVVNVSFQLVNLLAMGAVLGQWM